MESPPHHTESDELYSSSDHPSAGTDSGHCQYGEYWPHTRTAPHGAPRTTTAPGSASLGSAVGPSVDGPTPPTA